MKNCFKTVLAAVAVLVWLGASAQDDPSKETVIINPFTHTSAVSQAACDNIRAAVLSGFADRGRFHIVDALTDGTLSKLYADRNVEDAPPGTATRSFKSIVKVQNEEMVLLGGLDRNTRENSSRGVPFLARVPVIKWFFGKEKRNKVERTLNVFIKPTVIE